eukprot:jgi/Mesvir1/8893/Mv02776-RA.1
MPHVVLRSARVAGEHGHPALCAEADNGKIVANRLGPAREWEHWKVEMIDAASRVIALKSFHGTYLRTSESGAVSHGAEAQPWTVVELGPQKLALKSIYGKFLRCHDGPGIGDLVDTADQLLRWEGWYLALDDDSFTGILKQLQAAKLSVVLRSARSVGGKGHPALCAEWHFSRVCANRLGPARDWERWELEVVDAASHSVTLKSCHGTYLCSWRHGNVWHGSEAQRWTVVELDDGKVALRSRDGGYLRCGDGWWIGDSVNTAGCIQHWEEWMLALDDNSYAGPSNTYALSQPTAITAVTAASCLGALSLGLLAIPAVGFAAGGVAAGSVAAAIQSTVYGGATCGVFSILQAVGATGAWVAPAVVSGVAVAASGSLAASMAGAPEGSGPVDSSKEVMRMLADDKQAPSL